MLIGGFQKFSLIDYPNKISAVIFTQGCNFKCPFCHNPELVLASRFAKPIPEKDVLDFLLTRIGKIDGVVITGGEPTLQKSLISFLTQIKDMGYAIKLDTNGAHPYIIQILIDLQLIDYIAMDIKAPMQKYELLTNTQINTMDIRDSIALIMSSSINYEFRTTFVPSLLTEQDMEQIGTLIHGAKKFTRQEFVPSKKIIDPSLLDAPENCPAQRR